MTSSEAAAADAASVLSSTDTSILASRGEVEARALSIELAAQLLDRAPKEWRRAACVVAYPMNREMPGLGPMLLRVLLEAAPNESTRHALVHGFVDSTASWESSMSAGGSAAMEQFHECAAVFTGLGLGRGVPNCLHDPIPPQPTFVTATHPCRPARCPHAPANHDSRGD